MKFTKLDKCPEWPLVGDVTLGHWTNSIVEYFAEKQGDPPTHMHVYKPDTARKGFKEGKFTIPATITTVSYDD